MRKRFFLGSTLGKASGKPLSCVQILHLLRTRENMKSKRNQLESVPMNIATVPYSGKDEIIKYDWLLHQNFDLVHDSPA